MPPPVTDIIEIVAFGLIFVFTAAFANGLSVTPSSVWGPLKAHSQLSVMALIGNFIIVPGLVIGFFSAVDLGAQTAIAFALLSLVAGAPFVAWMTSLGKGNVVYGASLGLMLTIVTIVVMPLALPGVLSLLDTGADVSTWTLLWPMLVFIVVPLVAGMLVRARHPALAMELLPWLGPISIVALLAHITLMFVAYWDDFVDEFGSGAIAVSIAFPIIAMVIGFILSPPYVLSPVKAENPHWGTKLASAIGTAQKGSQQLICSLIFALGAYPVAGVVALASSVITIIILLLVVSELWLRVSGRQQAAAAVGADQQAPVAQPKGAEA